MKWLMSENGSAVMTQDPICSLAQCHECRSHIPVSETALTRGCGSFKWNSFVVVVKRPWLEVCWILDALERSFTSLRLGLLETEVVALLPLFELITREGMVEERFRVEAEMRARASQTLLDALMEVLNYFGTYYSPSGV